MGFHQVIKHVIRSIQFTFVVCLTFNSAIADHMTNESVKTVDIPTTFKPIKDEDYPSHELLSYKVSGDGITVSIRASNNSEYRATQGLCWVVGYKGDESFDRTIVSFYNQLGPGFNMVGSADFYISKDGRATWDKSNDISRILRVEIECDWTMRYSGPSELVEFKFIEYRLGSKGDILAHVSAVNNSDIALKTLSCAHTGIKDKEVLVSGLNLAFGRLNPGKKKTRLVKLFNVVGHDSHAKDIQALTAEHVDMIKQLDDYGLYCSYTGGPEY